MKKMIKRIIMLFIILSLACPLSPYAMEKNEKYIKSLQEFTLDDFGVLALYMAQGDVSGSTLHKPKGAPLTDYESYILGAIPLSHDIKPEVELVKNSQLESGKFADFADNTGEDLVNAHIWGVISLYCANEDGYDKESALDWILGNQNIDGGFPVYVDGESSLDITYMGIVALKMLGEDLESPYVQAAINYTRENSENYKTSESKAWEILSNDFLGIKVPLSTIKELLSYRLENGRFEHTKGGGYTYMSTWHGILAHEDWRDTTSSVFDRLRSLSKAKTQDKFR